MPFIIMTTLVISYTFIVIVDFCLEGKREALVNLVMRPWVKIDPMHFPPTFCFFYVSPAALWKFMPPMNKRGEPPFFCTV